MRIAVTGASGFVGRALCADAAARGHEVVALVRRPVTDLSNAVVRVVPSLEEVVDWRPFLQGVDAVVHAAAAVHVQDESARDDSRFRAINVTATTNLARAAADAGAKFLFVSSVKVHGDSSPVALRDDSAFAPTDAYGRSKAEAENLLGELIASGAHINVIRPPLVYGAGAGANFAKLVRLVLRGMPLPFGAVRNRRSVVYVHNLTDAMLAIIERAAPGDRFIVSDDEDVSTPELIRRIAEAAGMHARLVSVPEALLTPLLRTLSPAVAERLCGSLFVEPQRLRALAWRPPYDMRTALSRTIGALR